MVSFHSWGPRLKAVWKALFSLLFLSISFPLDEKPTFHTGRICTRPFMTDICALLPCNVSFILSKHLVLNPALCDITAATHHSALSTLSWWNFSCSLFAQMKEFKPFFIMFIHFLCVHTCMEATAREWRSENSEAVGVVSLLPLHETRH